MGIHKLIALKLTELCKVVLIKMTLVIMVHEYIILLKGYVYWLGLNNTLDINKYPRIIETT